MTKRRSSPERLRELAEAMPDMIAGGMSQCLIAEEWGCDRKTVTAICNRLGLTIPRKPSQRRQRGRELFEHVPDDAPAWTPLADEMPFDIKEVPASTYNRASARIASAELARRLLALYQKEAAPCR